MAERVKDFPKTPRLTRYPWHQWMDGSVWKLEQGVDFEGSLKTMRATVVAHARRHDVAVRTQVERDFDEPGSPERWLYVRFDPDRPFGRRSRR